MPKYLIKAAYTADGAKGLAQPSQPDDFFKTQRGPL